MTTTAAIMYDMSITGIYVGLAEDGFLIVNDGDARIGLQVTPAELRWLARELTELVRDPSRYEGWSHGSEHGDIELSLEGLLEITIEDDDDTVAVTVDVDDTVDALGLAVMLLDAADELADTRSPR